MYIYISYDFSFFLFFFLFFFFFFFFFFFSRRRRNTRWNCDWSSDVCSSDLPHHHHQGGEGDDVGNDVGDDGEVHEGVELLAQAGRDGGQRHRRLDDAEDDHARDRRPHPVHLGEHRREHLLLRRRLPGLGDRELPAQQRAQAGHHRQRHDDGADGRVEHVGIGGGERPRRGRELGV